MLAFDNHVEFLEHLRKEAKGDTRFPVRFVLIKGLDAWQMVVSSLKMESGETIRLSSLSEGADDFPYLGDLVARIDAADSEKILVLPFAECLRFSEHYGSVLVQLAIWEKICRKRIYVPLFEVADLFEACMNRVGRHPTRERPEAWFLRDKGEVKVQVTPALLKKGSGEIVNGVRAYLELWEDGGRSQVQLVTNHAHHLSGSVGGMEICVLGSSYELIKEYFQDGAFLDRSWGQEDQWQWLTTQLGDEENIYELAERLLNINSYDSLQLLTLWETIEENERWLLWLWSKLQDAPGLYLKRILEKNDRYEGLVEEIINGIFDHPLDDELLSERKQLLESLKVKVLPASFWTRLSAVTDPLTRLKLLTGITEREREEALSAIRELLKNGVERASWWSPLERAYPQLASYLAEFSHKDPFIRDYFRFYRLSKIMSAPQEQLIEMSKMAAQERKVWQFPTRDGLMESLDCGGTTILWVDGMGLEWMGLFSGAISRREGIQLDFHIARSNFPTTTKYNKGWRSDEEVERELDDLAHKSTYRFPQSMVKQIGVIEKVIDRAIDRLKEESEVVITSDHGLTCYFLNKIVVQPPEGAQIHKWGRCADLSGSCSDDTFTRSEWLVDDKQAFLAYHGRFEGGAGAVGEVHGGATLEECLVPVIRLLKNSDTVKQRIPELRIPDPYVRLNAKGEGILLIEMDAAVKSVSLRVIGKSYSGASKGVNRWEIPIKDLKAGSYRGTVEYEDGFLGEVEFEVSKGLLEEDLGL